MLTKLHPFSSCHCFLVSTSSQTRTDSTLPTTFDLGCCFLPLNLNEMAQQKRPPNSRGYYVKMKLLQKHGRPHHHHHHHQQEKNCFYRYYKWVLWLSLSLYFFTSYLISNNNNHHTKKPSHVSRALIQSNHTTTPQHALNSPGTYNQSHFISSLF